MLPTLQVCGVPEAVHQQEPCPGHRQQRQHQPTLDNMAHCCQGSIPWVLQGLHRRGQHQFKGWTNDAASAGMGGQDM